MWGRRIYKTIVIAIGLLFLTVAMTRDIYASEAPAFPSCLNPQGATVAQYSEGVHGIAGDAGQYSGVDTVYMVSADQALQCFCPPGGQGIQTNWWRVDELSQYQREDLMHQGWIEIPTGAIWGLDNQPYLAKNSSYSCLAQGGGGSTSGGGSSSSNSSGGGSSSGNGGGTGGGELASTGTLSSIYLTALIGLLCIVGGYITRRQS